MPQLAFGDFAPQLVWLAITFVFLYLVLSRVALPKIGSVLDMRANRIADDLDRAQKARDEAEKALKTYEAALASARQSAQATAQAARQALNDAAAQRQAALARDLAKRVAEAEGRIAAARTQALANVETVASEVARAAVSRLIGQPVDERQASAAVADALRSRG